MLKKSIRERGALVRSYPDRGLVFSRGSGLYLFTGTGERYLDLITNFGVNIFGHSHPALTEALSGQLAMLSTLHGSFGNEIRTRAAEELTARCGGGLRRVHFSNSGAEAVEAALKFAAAITGRRRFVAFRGGFHGKTLGALSATHAGKYRELLEPLLWDFRHVDYDLPEALEANLDEQTAACIVEPIQGEAGVLEPGPGFLREIGRICRDRNVLLIIDEIQTGVGRTGAFLASGGQGLRYDILCLGKGLAGGIPVGATLVSESTAAKIPRRLHTSTFGGNPLAAAGILATLALLDKTRLRHIREVGEYLKTRLSVLPQRRIREIRGRGLMLAVEIEGDATAVLRELQRRHVLAGPAGQSTVRFLPPFIMEERHADIAVAALEGALMETDSGQRRRRIQGSGSCAVS